MGKVINFELPEDILTSAHLTTEQVSEEAKKLLAFYLFSKGQVSGGKAAKVAGMSRLAFLMEASNRKIDWLSYSPDEVERELQ